MTDRPTAIVTGASSGIGRAIAERLAMEGYTVFGTSRTDHALHRLDVTDPRSCDDLVARILDETGRIDVLVNNAGYSLLGAQEELSDDEVRAMFEENLLGAMRLARSVLPAMRAARRGKLVHVSSVSGLIPSPFMGAYGATWCDCRPALRGRAAFRLQMPSPVPGTASPTAVRARGRHG